MTLNVSSGNGKFNFKWCLLTGVCLTGISSLLFVLLGTNSVVTYHDQLDGEVLCYLYHAKYLFQNSTIPEFMNGAGANALTPPAPLFILFYKLLPPFAAFVVCRYIGMITGFIGLYLLLTKGKVHPVIACLCGVLFAYLPLLSVYGLSMYGIPLAAWLLWRLCETEKEQKRQAVFLLVVLFIFACSSSLVLSGFAVLLGVFFVGIVWRQARKSISYWCGFGALTFGYLVCNRSLVAQVLGIGQTYVTHKEEMVLGKTSFFDLFWNLFINGIEHAQSYQKWIVFLTVCIFIAGVCKKEWQNGYWRMLGILFITAAGIALLSAGYESTPVLSLRNRLGGAAVWFQFSRIYWLYPALWYAALGLALQWLVSLPVKKRTRRYAVGIGLAVYGMTAVTVLWAGDWKMNVKNLLLQKSEGISWQEFYAEDVMTQVQEYLYETTNEQPEAYRVVSLGICPAAALYNGFYCLDGYSNNYPLEYKHRFRQVIEPELQKSMYLTEYFDTWGNRCYLCSSETPGYYTVEKGGFYYADFEMNVEAFQELGGKYVLSAAYIDQPERTGLTLLREEPFETEKAIIEFIYME